MVEKEVGICKGSISTLLRVADLSLAVVKNYNLVDAEYGTCSGDLADEACLLVVCKCTKNLVSFFALECRTLA